jgi:hypothetical protein
MASCIRKVTPQVAAFSQLPSESHPYAIHAVFETDKHERS